jgi:hypothetical protein
MTGFEPPRRAPRPIHSLSSAYQQRMQAQDYEHLGQVVGLAGYPDDYLGLTGWRTGFQVALKNYANNMIAASPWPDNSTSRMTGRPYRDGRSAGNWSNGHYSHKNDLAVGVAYPMPVRAVRKPSVWRTLAKSGSTCGP